MCVNSELWLIDDDVIVFSVSIALRVFNGTLEHAIFPMSWLSTCVLQEAVNICSNIIHCDVYFT